MMRVSTARIFVPLLLLTALPFVSADENESPVPYAWDLTELPADGEGISPAPLGAQLPEGLQVHNPAGETLDLRAVIAEQSLSLLIVYRGGWCPFCTTQLAGLAQQAEALKELDVQLLGLSPDSAEALATGLAEADEAPPYRLLSDASLAVISRFGLGFALDEATITRYQGFGLLLAENSFGQVALPVPALYLIDQTGIIRWAHIDPDFRTRPDAEVVVTAVREAAAAHNSSSED